MPHVYVHIGTHKTGSTAIQRALNASAPALARRGISRVVLPDALELRHEDVEPGLVESQRTYLEDTLEERSDLEKVVISREGLSGKIRNGYRNAGTIARRVEEITSQFPTSIIVYLRRQDTFLESAYAQKVHMGDSYRFSEFLESIGEGSFDWYDHIRSYGEIFGEENLVVRTYDKNRLERKGGLLADFGEILGIPTLEPSTARDVTSNPGYTPNAGLNGQALEVARICNEFLSDDELFHLREVLKGSNAKRPYEKYRFFSPEERREFLEQYAASNRRVAEEFLGSRDRLFSDPVQGEYSAIDQGEEQFETLAVVLARALVRAERREPYSVKMLRKLEDRVIERLDELPHLKQTLVDLVQSVIGYK